MALLAEVILEFIGPDKWGIAAKHFEWQERPWMPDGETELLLLMELPVISQTGAKSAFYGDVVLRLSECPISGSGGPIHLKGEKTPWAS